MIMKRALVAMVITAIGLGVEAGTCEYTFSEYRNAPVDGLQVPLALEEGLRGFSYAGFKDKEGGTDLRVYDTDGVTQLAYEIENWTNGGRSVVWVKVPHFSKDTCLRLEWGDETAPAVQGENIWTDMNVVWHLSKGATDSSVFKAQGGDEENKKPCAAIGVGMTAGTAETDAVWNRSLAAEQTGAITNQFTISFWVNLPTGADSSGSKYLAMLGEATGQVLCPVYNFQGKGLVSLYSHSAYTGTNIYRKDSSLEVLPGGWHHVAIAYDGTTLRGYVDGFEKLNKSITFSLNVNTKPRQLGVGGVLSTGFDGLRMDEYRIERVARGAEWIRAACETQFAALNKGVEVAFADYGADDPVMNFQALAMIDANAKGYKDVGSSIIKLLVQKTAVVVDGKTNVQLPYEVDTYRDNDAERYVTFWTRVPVYSAETRLIIKTPSSVYVPTSPTAAQTGTPWDDADLLLYHMQPETVRSNSVWNSNFNLIAANSTGKSDVNKFAPPMDGPTGLNSAVKTATNILLRTSNSFGTSASATTSFPPRPVTNVFTISFWAKKDDYAFPRANLYLLHFFRANSNQRSLIGGFKGNNSNYLYFFGCGNAGYELPIPDADWHHYAFVKNGTTATCYRDGTLLNTANNSVNLDMTQAEWGLSAGSASDGGHALAGGLDELRVSDIARSAAWVKACYRNQQIARDGLWRVPAPHFGPRPAAVGTFGEITFSARLSCSVKSALRLYYDVEDRGATETGWAHFVDVGAAVDDGTVEYTVGSLSLDTGLVARFAAKNDYSDGWVFSDAASARTCPRDADKKARRSARVSFAYAGAPLTNFPVAVRIPAANKLPETPDAFRVVGLDGRVLAHEVEKWNPSGESVVWVLVPELKADTQVSLEWGFRNVAALPAVGKVWDDLYVRANHFRSDFVDSATLTTPTTNGIGTLTSGQVLGDAVMLDGRKGILKWDKSTAYGFAKGFTLSLWAKIEDACGAAYVWGNTSGSPQLSVIYNFDQETEADKLTLYEPYPFVHKSSTIRTNAAIVRGDANWHHYVWTYDGTSFATYKDGERYFHELYNTQFLFAGAWSTITELDAFYGCTSADSNHLVGGLDECRFERTGRSETWLKACYDNQKPGSTFATVAPTALGSGLILMVK